MKRTIWKITLNEVGSTVVPLPVGATVLSVDTQYEQPRAWVLVDLSQKDREERHFDTYWTGHPLPDGDLGTYVGTCQDEGSDMVFHVFVDRPQP